MTQTITIQQLQEHASELLASLGVADEIIISDGDKPVAKISPPPPASPPSSQPRESGFWAGQVWVAPDFDEPLPDSFWLGEE